MIHAILMAGTYAAGAIIFFYILGAVFPEVRFMPDKWYGEDNDDD